MAIPPRSRGSTNVRATRSPVSRGLLLPVQQYIHNEVVGGVTLLIAALAALIWANSPWSEAYYRVHVLPLSISVGLFSIGEDLRHWVNDGLMAIFFFVVGLEIKRELVRGELSDARRAALPVAAALGGMALPALIYFSLNAGGEGAPGWGIPMATDIAFAMGVLAVLGRRIPSQLRIFLLALAIVDDIGAILVIAVFYAAHLSWVAIGAAVLLLALVKVMLAGGVRNTFSYLFVGLLFWLAVFQSGIHATIAGVALGAITPATRWFSRHGFTEAMQSRMQDLGEALDHEDQEKAEAVLGQIEELARETESPLDRLERTIHPWVSYLVLPLFALVNTGVALSGEMLRAAASSPVTIGVVGGLLLGKIVGIAGFSWLAVRGGVATLSKELRWSHLIGAGLLGGIGFTVSLFITDLAFSRSTLIDEAKVGILAASLIAGLGGYAWLRWVTNSHS